MPSPGDLLASLFLAPPSPEAVRRAVEEVYRDDGIQRDLPSPEAPWSFTPPAWWGRVAEVLLWAGVAVVVALVVAWLVREVASRGRRAALPGAAAAPGLDASVLRAPLEAAEALAAKGLWAEAIHALLLKTLATLVAVTRTVLPPALTSREILGRVPLEDRPRAALSDLVLAVEVSRFGGAAAGAEDYARCLDRFRQFAAAYGRTA